VHLREPHGLGNFGVGAKRGGALLEQEVHSPKENLSDGLGVTSSASERLDWATDIPASSM
jgi:hypothetical protein